MSFYTTNSKSFICCFTKLSRTNRNSTISFCGNQNALYQQNICIKLLPCFIIKPETEEDSDLFSFKFI